MNPDAAFQFDLDEKFPHLARAPIVEAVVQWLARAGKPLSPEELRAQLVERLPDYPDIQAQRALSLEAQFQAGGLSRHVQQDTWLGFRCISADKLHIAQFTRDGVVFSRLKPYGDWQAFSSEAMRIWKLFVELAQPTEVQRLGVRFINSIAAMGITDLRKYLARPPASLESLGLPVTTFLWQSRHAVPGQPFELNLVQTIQPTMTPQADGLGLILDIDAFTTQAFPPRDEIVAEYLAKLRWLKDKAFFSLLKKSAVKLFQKEIA